MRLLLQVFPRLWLTSTKNIEESDQKFLEFVTNLKLFVKIFERALVMSVRRYWLKTDYVARGMIVRK